FKSNKTTFPKKKGGGRNRIGKSKKVEEADPEKVVEKHVVSGKVEYFLRKKGFDADSTREPEEFFHCPELKDFLILKKLLKKNRVQKENLYLTVNQMTANQRRDTADKPRGLARGPDPEGKIGATDSSGKLMFLMKWKDSDEADLVLAKESIMKCAQIIIAFYEERLTWHSCPEDEAQ
uniref:Chromo domain-containing protein n=1 Tax=Mustela putorius furo TaxID=9669 RepID=M3XZG5_MUSPF